ncbi:MAG: efflux RND transporter periplasmic adaptor subunit [Gammaproteobacteria bacterium]|nr:efflux RND transporter periplasmic adaptor subunit [Gammaproteobacteria bacterium]MCP5135626.1 efflux RND transporter periplasmic adaptor subunit [Gammaproteobacteria bacterium]
MNKAVTSVLIAGLVAAGLQLSTVQAEGEGATPTPAAAHDIIVVKSQSSGGVVVLGGTVMPEKIVNLSAQMPGDVEFVGGSEGDEFKKGDRLVALDTTALQAKRVQAVSQLASADAGYRNSLVQYNREVFTPNSQSNSMLGGMPGMFSMFSDPMRSVMGQGSPGYERHSNLYGQGVQIETARNAVEQARAGLRELDDSLENAVSYAPFDGVILKKMVEQGDIVQPGMPLVTFADITKLQVRVEVPTGVLNAIKQGGVFQAKLDNDAAPVDVEVDRVFPMADPGGHTTTVKFNLPVGTLAHSGQYAEVLIPDPSKQASAYPGIPKSSILWRGSLPAVFLVDDAGELKLRLIRVGETSANGVVSVISGIKVGDKILANPSAGTRSGS